MTTYTSGYRAAHNLPPVECYDCGELATDRYRDAYGRGRSMPVCEEDGRYYATQGERVETILDNPILVEFRKDRRSTTTALEDYLWVLVRPYYPSIVDYDAIVHAIRVLSKLAAVYA